ncbi:MAG: PEP-CTERM sorting domain-containing protein, partial [Gammaproteobacteria bacterium]
SFDLPVDLETFQEDDFSLATIEFTAKRIGTSALVFTQVLLSDAAGLDLVADVDVGLIEVLAAQNLDHNVPEPSVLGLLLLGLGFIVSRVSFRRNA